MTAHIVGGLSVALDDGPVRARYDRDPDGKQRATLILGDGSSEIGITVTGSTPELLDLLVDRVTELRDWAIRQEQLKHLPEYDATICGSRCPEHAEHYCRRSPGHQPHICRDRKQKGTESCTWDAARSTKAVA